MIYLSAALIALVAFQQVHYGLLIDKIRAAHAQDMEGLLNRIQAPEMAVALAAPDPEGEAYISAFDDKGLAEYEMERFNRDTD